MGIIVDAIGPIARKNVKNTAVADVPSSRSQNWMNSCV